MNAVPDMLFQVRKDGTISSFRSAKVTKTSYPDDFTGKHIAEIIPSELFDDCLNKINEAFNTKEVIVFEFPVENFKRKRFYEARIVAYSYNEVLALIRDITKRKLKEETLKKNQELLKQELKRLKTSIKGRNPFEGIVGRSKKMLDVFDEILKAASGSAHLLIHGESGTGKELVARAVHDLSDRSSKGFVPVNCGAIPENLLESEFFGYRKGAFTGAVSDKKGFMELADSGTLFMDEIGEINLNMQVKLLRVIEGGGFTPVGGVELLVPDIRIIGATNKNPFELVKQKLLRQDFFYRINIIQIILPPLRERLEDLPLLVYHFLEKFGKGVNFPSIPSKIMDRFLSHSWPGNVRELENAVHRYVTMGKIELSTMDGLPKKEEIECENTLGTDLKTALNDFERRHILKVLELNKWQKGKTASLLGVHRKTLFRKLKELGIE
ncbi:MAG: sigma-54 dependent transcriptional regulator [Desulforegulaceae bacterium]|nr:sigma-54 dependent transcriptional regulator [Desulforegulaceae bacterium]